MAVKRCENSISDKSDSSPTTAMVSSIVASTILSKPTILQIDFGHFKVRAPVNKRKPSAQG